MSEFKQRRSRADIEGDFVVFLIGARLTKGRWRKRSAISADGAA